MNKIKFLILPALILLITGCFQSKQAETQQPVQQVAQEVNKVNEKVEEVEERVQKLEEDNEIQNYLASYGKYMPKNTPSDWITYRDNEHGFELKHPAEWKKLETDPSKAPRKIDNPALDDISMTIISNQWRMSEMKDPSDAEGFHVYGVAVSVFEGQNPDNLTTSEFFNQDMYKNPPTDGPNTFEYIKYATIDGIELYFQKTEPPTMPVVQFTKGDDLYFITDGVLFFSDAPPPTGQWDTILSSLKFD